ncbi:TetR/AcrR family transcriptional regulator [Bombilactobacillus thymidiniphilus]|uniref:TetR/AcrR family transcriptional regulator n=1 Tax=Bombilactobacillus thymidiniphilus TaxID=2923363 RepID=A0ABY4PEJ1_9LACO|nr:TetR/AcrR family transcriptional regulator [Bombilactobacillus thymidiniphilus]UQS84208.1 TetR/AcrR family transcriptional regulator [Bombilactobacillus thymidiniphilus]
MTSHNRRISYTKQSLQTALIDLMQTERFDDITVKQLCVTANVNRSTFYAHYHNLLEVITDVEQQVRTYLMDSLITVQGEDGLSFYESSVLEEFLLYIKDNLKIFKVLLGDESFFYFTTDITECVINGLQPKHSFYTTMYFVCGFFGLIRYWVMAGLPDKIADISKQLSKIYLSKVHSAEIASDIQKTDII